MHTWNPTERLSAYRGGSGETVMFIHGLGHDWRCWRPVLPELERHFEVLALDLPGFGASPPLAAGVRPSPETLAAVVEGELKRLGISQVHIVGNSLGASIALELGRRGRARSVTAIAPTGLSRRHERVWEIGLLSAMHLFASRLAVPSAAALRVPALRHLYAGPAVAAPWRASADYIRDSLHTFGHSPAFGATLLEMSRSSLRGLHEIECPVLLLWGTRDRIVPPRQGRRAQAAIPGAELRYLHGLGHCAMNDDPQLVSAAIARFIGRHASVPRSH